MYEVIHTNFTEELMTTSTLSTSPIIPILGLAAALTALLGLTLYFSLRKKKRQYYAGK